MTFATRSQQLELLDAPGVPFADIARNMKELNTINTWLGGHRITIDGFKKLATGKKEISVCEIGCGGGDNLAAIYTYAKQNGIKVHLTGIDIKDACIAYAKQKAMLPTDTEFIINDYKTAPLTRRPDIAFSSLFCHHFTKEELIDQLLWMKANSRIGFFINDLHRHPLAYYSIQFLTQTFSRSYLVKNDAPLSVKRGFIKKELEEICALANCSSATISWKWAFRYLVTYHHDR